MRRSELFNLKYQPRYLPLSSCVLRGLCAWARPRARLGVRESRHRRGRARPAACSSTSFVDDAATVPSVRWSEVARRPLVLGRAAVDPRRAGTGGPASSRSAARLRARCTALARPRDPAPARIGALSRGVIAGAAAILVLVLAVGAFLLVSWHGSTAGGGGSAAYALSGRAWITRAGLSGGQYAFMVLGLQ
jgi:hypothetical protein